MANPEYEAKINPADLYNDEILETFESIRSVIHKEILPSTYNELIVTSNQAGVFNTEFPLGYYPSTELIFPLSPQSGNVNWLEKNFLRFRLDIADNNGYCAHLIDYPLNTAETVQNASNAAFFNKTILGIQDGASIFKSIEINYGGTAIWTSAYQEVEAFFTYANIPNSLVEGSPQYVTNFDSGIYGLGTSEHSSASCGKDGGNDAAGNNGSTVMNNTIKYSLLIDIDVSRLSPILSWMSIIPGFINKLTLRVILEAPANYLCLKFVDDYNALSKDEMPSEITFSKPVKNTNLRTSSWCPIPKDGTKLYNAGNVQPLSYNNIKWKMSLCEIHQCNATMTEDTRIRLISLIQQMGGKWIYPCRYWNTTIAPIQKVSNANDQSLTFQFVLTGCYFRSISFTILSAYENTDLNWHPANGCFAFPSIKNLKIFADSELIANYNSILECMTDSDSALIDNDKYSIPKDVLASLYVNQQMFYTNKQTFNNGIYRDCISKALGPPNGLYSGKYTSEKMGTHNIIVQMTFDPKTVTTYSAWLGALQDGVIVFDNFNGNYFSTGRKMQQIYEALS